MYCPGSEDELSYLKAVEGHGKDVKRRWLRKRREEAVEGQGEAMAKERQWPRRGSGQGKAVAKERQCRTSSSRKSRRCLCIRCKR